MRKLPHLPEFWSPRGLELLIVPDARSCDVGGSFSDLFFFPFTSKFKREDSERRSCPNTLILLLHWKISWSLRRLEEVSIHHDQGSCSVFQYCQSRWVLLSCFVDFISYFWRFFLNRHATEKCRSLASTGSASLLQHESPCSTSICNCNSHSWCKCDAHQQFGF